MTSGNEDQPAGLGDNEITGWLEGLLERTPSAPPELRVDAGHLYALRGLDAHYAALTADSGTDARLPHAEDAARAGIPAARNAVPVRSVGTSGNRRLEFEAASISVILEVTEAGRGLRLQGSVAPEGPVRVELQRPGAGNDLLTQTDPRGAFVLDGVAPGPARLVCHRGDAVPVTLQWVLL